MSSFRRTLVVAALGAALLLTGCTGEQGGAGDAPVATEIDFPSTQLGEKSEWVVDQLNGGQDMVGADWEGELSETLLSEMTADKLVAVLNKELRADAPFMLVGFKEQGGHALVDVVGESGTKRQLTIAVDKDSNTISGFFFREA